MPFYFDVNRVTASHGTGSTELTHLLFLTVANQQIAKLKALYGSAVFGTAGGAKLRARTCATAGSGGTGQTPGKRNPSNPAAQTVVTNDATSITPGGTPTNRLTVGLAQTGGNGGWVALEPDAAITLLPNAGANGNLEIASIANAASVPLDVTAELSEGG